MIRIHLALLLASSLPVHAQEAGDTGWYPGGNVERTTTPTADEHVECNLGEPPEDQPRIEWSVSDDGRPELVVISGDAGGEQYEVEFSMTFDGHFVIWQRSFTPRERSSWTVPVEVSDVPSWSDASRYYVQLRARMKVFGPDRSGGVVSSAGTVLVHMDADGGLGDAIPWAEAMQRGGYDADGTLATEDLNLVNADGDSYILAGVSPVHRPL
jgi:hypothetical protein